MISVIVAVYNGERLLQRCIDSVASQSHRDRELIIIDGGSGDGTQAIIRANASTIAHWESEPDRGIYHAWNKALAHMRGEWACFLGADDYFSDRDSLAVLAAASPGAELVSGRVALVDESGRSLRILGEAWNWPRMKYRQVIAHPGALHHRSLFVRHGEFDEQLRIAGDYEFLLRLGPSLAAGFVDQVIVCAGAGGVSRHQLIAALAETRIVQAAHPEIGMTRAAINYGIALAKVGVKTCMYPFMQRRW